MPDDVATQGQSSGTQATQGTHAGKDGVGAPNDAPPAEEMFTQTRVKAIAAKEARAAREAERRAVLEQYGVADESELSELISLGQKARPKKQDDNERLAQKLQAAHDAEKAELVAKLKAIQEAHELARVRETAKGILANAGLVEGGADMLLAVLGLNEKPEHQLAMRDGAVTVVDRDGDPTGKTVEKFLMSLVPEYLKRGITAGGTGKRPAIEPKPQPEAAPAGPARKRTQQEEIDGAVAAGLASVQGRVATK